MKPVMNLDTEYAVALEGGGARGAYQIGAWRALADAGVKIKAVSGTSVGALNGALMCMGALKEAEKVWSTMNTSKVFVDEKTKISEWLEHPHWINFFKELGLDITPLKNLICELVSEEKVRQSPVEFYLLTYSLSERRELDMDAKELPDGYLTDMLLASAYLPMFKQQDLHGQHYMDNGMFSNVPFESLIKRGYKDILAIRIYGLGHERHIEIPEDVKVTSVIPHRDLGGILQFEEESCKKNMLLGYYDAQRMIYGLLGKHYYLDDALTEQEAFRRLTDVSEEVMIHATDTYASVKDRDILYRMYIEKAIPGMADDFEFKEEPSYKELYLAMLERTARIYKVDEFHVYTIDGLREKIEEQAKVLINKQELPPFISVIRNHR